MKKAWMSRGVTAIVLLAILAGCASGRRVECDGRLEPVNSPVPKEESKKSTSLSAIERTP